jgi:hypothetical protein
MRFFLAILSVVVPACELSALIDQEIKIMLVTMRISIFVIAFFFCSNATMAQDEDEVKITAQAVKDTVHAGRETKFVFHMQPAEGFHVNVEPQIKLALLETKNFTLAAEKFMPEANAKTLTTEDGYKIFDPKHTQPVTFAVKVAKGLKPGKYPVKAKLTYFFCSDKDGYCSFKNQEFVFNLLVVK